MRISSASKHHPLHHRRRKLRVPLGAQRFLAAFEGFEGGFAIGTSIVIALSFATDSRHVLLLTAIISIIVNGFNNASLKYSSEHYLDELDGRETRHPLDRYFMPALVEFLSYFAISFLTVVPLIVIANLQTAIMVSTLLTLVLLFAAGYWRAYMLHVPRLRDAIETMLLGSGIIVVGVVSGVVVRHLA
ncbi:MAG: VIT1/CCC1 transporter family protein [Candidatus Saccharimonas sp.]